MVKPGIIELLAPAGKWDTMVEVLAAGADAVYLGSKRFNMRMLRADHNFSDEQLREAVSYCHERDKKLYVTVNNLVYQDEVAELKDYLGWLAAIEADAVIVQDLAVASLVNQAVPGLPLHASVQMGVANAGAAQFLAGQGFTRAILSKNVSRSEIASIHQASSLELEYFIHGDVCISHTGQCYLSAFIFGESGNRGRCKKPCRWSYRINGEIEHPEGYYLAHQDLCLINDLPALLAAGVVSLKIEGRMRDASYLSTVVKAYRQALTAISQGDRIPEEACEMLAAQRVRDFTAASFSHRPTLDDIGVSGDREPLFPTAPQAISASSSRMIPVERAELPAEIQVIITDQEAAAAALGAGIKTIIIGGNGFYPHGKMDLPTLVELVTEAGAQLVYQLPRVITEGQIDGLEQQLKQLKALGVTTVMVSDIGSMYLARQQGFRTWGDFSLNTANAEAASFLAKEGVERVTAALELRQPQLEGWLKSATIPVDVLVHGWLPGIITDLCLRQLVNEGCPQEGQVSPLFLVDKEDNRYPVVCDQSCRHHIYYPFKLSLLEYLPYLEQKGVAGLRLDLSGYPNSQVSEVIAIYQQALENSTQEARAGLIDLKAVTGEEFTASPFTSVERG